MRIVLSLVAALMVLLGGVWILQGINILPGSFMTGDLQWAIYGAVLAALGGALLFWANRPRPKP